MQFIGKKKDKIVARRGFPRVLGNQVCFFILIGEIFVIEGIDYFMTSPIHLTRTKTKTVKKTYILKKKILE